MKNIQNKQKGVLLILLSALMFGSYGVWSRLIGSSFDVFYQGWTRGLIVTVLLIPLLWYRKEFVRIEKKDRPWLSVYLIFTAFTQAPIFYAFNHMDIGSATLLFFVSMLITMYTFGFIFLGEKLTRVKCISFILACAGLYYTFSFSWVLFSLLAAGAAIVNGLASGGEVASSKKLSGNYSPLYLTWLSWVIIAVTNIVPSLLLGERQVVPSFNMVWFYQFCYVIASFVGFWSIIAGLKYVEASIGGLIGLLEIIFSISFGIILFHEALTEKVLIGAVLILLAAALPHIRDLHKNKQPL
ncbi:DMT family transporter [Candidatus Nomurabacteria bacterium]|nr:DMT family transporter [Candidatus Nomurabacteria bacterium]